MPKLLDTRSEAPAAGELLDLRLHRVDRLEDDLDLTQRLVRIDVRDAHLDVVRDPVDLPERAVDGLKPHPDRGGYLALVRPTDGSVRGLIVWQFTIEVDSRFVHDFALFGDEDSFDALGG